MCPHCGIEAPIVYRGPLAYCTSCNKPRAPLSGTGVNLAGKPAQLGGTVASVVGWVVLAAALAVALILGAVLQAIFPPGAVVGWAVGGVIAALGIAAALVLLLGGRFLQRSGDKAAFTARREAVFALAQNQGGILRAEAAARSLGISPAEANVYLTDLSREPEAGVILEVDNDGKFFFRFSSILPELPWPPPGGLAPANGERLRVRTEVSSPAFPAPPAPPADALDDAVDEGPDPTKRARVAP